MKKGGKGKEEQDEDQSEEQMQVKIDIICNKTVDKYIEMIQNKKVYFEVEHQGSRAVFEIKKPTQTFGEIEKTVAQYFSLKKDMIFFKNDRDEVLLDNMEILPTLFPMLSSKFVGQTPLLKVALQKNQNTLDYIKGDEVAQANLAKEQEQAEESRRR